MSKAHSLPVLPIVCTLNGKDLGDRLRAWAELGARALAGQQRVDDHVVLRYRREPGVEEELRRLVSLEVQCCAFLAFEFQSNASEIVLTVAGPETAAPIIEGFLQGSSG